jgi:hypothetical protein
MLHDSTRARRYFPPIPGVDSRYNVWRTHNQADHPVKQILVFASLFSVILVSVWVIQESLGEVLIVRKISVPGCVIEVGVIGTFGKVKMWSSSTSVKAGSTVAVPLQPEAAGGNKLILVGDQTWDSFTAVP